MKKLILACLIPFAINAKAHAGEIITSTTTAPGLLPTSIASVNLAVPAVYMFDLAAAPAPSTATFSGLSVWIQQQGPSGNWYTIQNSTFTTCSAACYEFVTPELYEGGNVRAQWSVTSGSVTFTVTARQEIP